MLAPLSATPPNSKLLGSLSDRTNSVPVSHFSMVALRTASACLRRVSFSRAASACPPSIFGSAGRSSMDEVDRKTVSISFNRA